MAVNGEASRASDNLGRVDSLVRLVEDDVGGLVEAPQRPLKQSQPSVAAGRRGDALITGAGGKARQGELAYHDVAAVVGDDGYHLCIT
jgi:hypothetical protein